jgi:hypothetical protein
METMTGPSKLGAALHARSRMKGFFYWYRLMPHPLRWREDGFLGRSILFASSAFLGELCNSGKMAAGLWAFGLLQLMLNGVLGF